MTAIGKVTGDSALSFGFLLAGAYNVLGILIFSRFFTNELLFKYDPIVFSWLGQVSIMLWGFAYIAVARSYRHVLFIVFVFFVEKIIYVSVWLSWLMENGSLLNSIDSEDILTGVFFRVYGLGDFLSALFFGWVLFVTWRNRQLS